MCYALGMRVLKFGGSSVGTPDRVKNVVSLISEAAKGNSIVVVISAFRGVTDQLIMAAKLAGTGGDYLAVVDATRAKHIDFIESLFTTSEQKEILANIDERFKELKDLLHSSALLKEESPREHDAVISFGEILSCSIIASYGKSIALPFAFYDARELITTDDAYGNARVDFEKTNKTISEVLGKIVSIPIVTGFIARAPDGSTTTLGRSGSDYTASIVGAALDAECIEIWTDVDGVMTADPCLVPDAFVLPKISYEEAMEMSHFGAKVIHPQTVQPAVIKKIPLLIKNTFNPTVPGTIISEETTNHGMLAKGIAVIDQCALIVVSGAFMIGTAGSAVRVLEALARKKVNVIIMSQGSSEYTICLGVKSEAVPQALAGLNEEFKIELGSRQMSFAVRDNQAVIAVVGDGMKGKPGVAGKLFQTLGASGVNIDAIAQGGSERNISLVVSAEQKLQAMLAIHEAFFSKIKTVQLLILGCGGVGGTLLERINEGQDILVEQNIKIVVLGIADSKHLLLDQRGIDLSSWRAQLGTAAEASEKTTLLHCIQKAHGAHAIVVDCTSSADVASWYPDIVRAGAHIVAANKKSNSATMEEYRLLRKELSGHTRHFLYETNVGGGLPILSTVRRLLTSGDTITHLEAVLSGTLSYLMNTYDGTVPWSELVQKAQAEGITEPDPRDDLSGMDVARKLLILVREMGEPIELSDITVESLVPEDCVAVSKENFITALAGHDAEFAKRYTEAKDKGLMLRFVAEYRAGKITVGMREVSRAHALARLSGTDNMVIITSDLYNKTPLVIQGPGAGRDVTAAGVLADIIKLSQLADRI